MKRSTRRLLSAVFLGCMCACIAPWSGSTDETPRSAEVVAPQVVARESERWCELTPPQAAPRSLLLKLVCEGVEVSPEAVEYAQLEGIDGVVRAFDYDEKRQCWCLEAHALEPEVTLVVVAHGYLPVRMFRHVTAGNLYRLELQSAACVKGQVVDSRGVGAAAAKVTLLLPHNARRLLRLAREGDSTRGTAAERIVTSGDEDGRFEVWGLPPAESYALQCESDRGVTRTVWVTLLAGENDLGELKLARGRSLSVTVDGWRGSPQPFEVSLYLNKRGAWMPARRAELFPGSARTFVGLPDSAARLIARRYVAELNAWELVATDVNLNDSASAVDADVDRQVHLEVATGPELAVQGLHPDGEPLDAVGVTVMHLNVAPFDLDRVPLGDDGWLRLRGLPAGWVSVILTSSEWATAERVFDFSAVYQQSIVLERPQAPPTPAMVSLQCALAPAFLRELPRRPPPVHWLLRSANGVVLHSLSAAKGVSTLEFFAGSIPPGECRLFAEVDGRLACSLPFQWPTAEVVEVGVSLQGAEYRGAVSRAGSPGFGEVWLVPHVDGRSQRWRRSAVSMRTVTDRHGYFVLDPSMPLGGRGDVVWLPGEGASKRQPIRLCEVDLAGGVHELGTLELAP